MKIKQQRWAPPSHTSGAWQPRGQWLLTGHRDTGVSIISAWARMDETVLALDEAGSSPVGV